MSENLTKKEFEHLKAEGAARTKLCVYIFGLFVFFVGMAYLSPPQYVVVPLFIIIALAFASCVLLVQSMYFRKCPRCGGSLTYTKSACLSCGVKLYQVGKQPEGTEWLQ